MPFDSIGFQKESKPDLSEPSLPGLSWLLRHKEAWPSNHTWDFNFVTRQTRCGTAGCALGLAAERWYVGRRFLLSDLCCRFGMEGGNFNEIFGVVSPGPNEPINYSPYYRKDRDLVSPEEVADAIDAYLAKTNK